MDVVNQSALLKKEGVLYIHKDYYQAQGLSIILANLPAGTHFQALRTSYEYWIDAQNPWRYRTATTESLDDGPHLVYAAGSNGIDSWWKVNVPKGITQPERFKGRAPLLKHDPKHRTEMSFDIWLENFTRPSKYALERLRRGEIEEIGRAGLPFWGEVLYIRSYDSKSKHIKTYTIRVAEPQVQIAWSEQDSEGKIFQTLQITQWEWIDPKQLDEGFWMGPPDPKLPIRK